MIKIFYPTSHFVSIIEVVTLAAEVMLNASMKFACVLAIGRGKHAISVSLKLFDEKIAKDLRLYGRRCISCLHLEIS